MKMTKESYDAIVKVFDENIEEIKEYAPKLRDSGNFKEFDLRLAWDCLRAYVGTRTICSRYYDSEGLHDGHIATASKKALRELNII